MKRTSPAPAKLSTDVVREIERIVFDLADQAVREACPNCVLLDVTFEKEAGAWFLRVTIEKSGSAVISEDKAAAADKGVSLNDCEAVSRLLDPRLDACEPLLKLLDSTSYSLEVSSPGLFRPLSKARELAFYLGHPVRVETRPGKGKKTGLQAVPSPQEGILLSYDEARHTVTLKKAESDQTFEVILDEGRLLSLNPTIHFPETDETD